MGWFNHRTRWGRWWGHPHRCPHNHNPLLEANKKRQCFDPCEINVFFSFFRGGFWCGDAFLSSFYVFFFFGFDQLLVENQPNHFGECSISKKNWDNVQFRECHLVFLQITIYIYVYIYAWNPKQPFTNGCFNWMIPNLYIENGCFTKHPFINGCLGFQVYIEFYLHDIQIQNCRKKEDDWSWLMLSPGSAFFNSMPSELSSSTAMNLGRGSKKEVGNGTIWIWMGGRCQK